MSLARLYLDAQLPDVPTLNPTVCFHRSTMVELREAYRELLEFAAAVCGKPAERLTAGDTCAKLWEVCPPDKMTLEQLNYWRQRPDYMSWAMLVAMVSDGDEEGL